jgi:hypothetical protein
MRPFFPVKHPSPENIFFPEMKIILSNKTLTADIR